MAKKVKKKPASKSTSSHSAPQPLVPKQSHYIVMDYTLDLSFQDDMIVAAKDLDGVPMQYLAQKLVATKLKTSINQPVGRARSDLQLYHVWVDPMPKNDPNEYCFDGEITEATYLKNLTRTEKGRWLAKIS